MVSISPSWQETDIPPNRMYNYLIPSTVLLFEALQINSTSLASLSGRTDSYTNKFNDVRGAFIEKCTECQKNKRREYLTI